MGSRDTGSKRTSRATTTTRTRVGGSARKPLPGARRVSAVASDEPVEVTVIVRPREPLPAPDELGAPAIEAVLGLDNRPQATADCRAVPREHAEEARKTSFTPSRIAQLYEFPRRLDGSGQRIAVLELGGGFRRASLRRYFAKIGKPM